MVAEQGGIAAVLVGEQVAARVRLSTTDWWICMELPGSFGQRLGHEGGVDIVAHGGMADRALEQEHLVGQRRADRRG